MNKGDRIIWDSHFGYDIGYYIGGGVMYNTHHIELMTGKYPGGELSVPLYEIHPYSDKLITELTKKYGYEKAFAKDF